MRAASFSRVLAVTLLALVAACSSPMTDDAGDVTSEEASIAPDVTDTGSSMDAVDRVEPADVPPDLSTPEVLDDAFDAVDVADVADVPDVEDVVDAGEDAGEQDVVEAAVEIDVEDIPDTVEPIDAIDVMDVMDVMDSSLDVGPDVVPGTCTHPIAGTITAPGSYDGTLAGTGTIAATRCLNRTPGPDDVLALRIDARTGIVISADDSRTMVDAVLAIRRACDDLGSEIACNNDDGIIRTTAPILRTVLDPGDYQVVVDTASTGGAYHLEVTTFAAGPGSDCGSAIMLTPGTPVSADLNAAGMQSLSCRIGSGGGQLFFAVDVPPMTRVSVSYTPAGFTAPLVMRALVGCDPNACLDEANADLTSGQVQFANEGTTTSRFYVTVALLSTTRPSVAFTLVANFSPTAPNATCTAAQTLTPSAPLSSQDTGQGGNAATACDVLADGGQLYYSLTIPAGTRADVTAALASGGRLSTRVFDTCPPTTCIANVHGNLNENIVQPVYNEGPTPRTVIVAVSGSQSTAPVTFDLSVNFVTLLPNAYCPAATALSTSTITGQNTTLGGSADTRCLPSRGPELYYAVDVPARTGAAVTVQPPAGQRASVRVFDACDATACVTSTTSPATGPNAAVVSIYNLGSTAHTYYVGVSGNGPAATVSFSIGAQLTPLATNADCTMPTPIAPGTTLTGQDTTGGGAPDTHCTAPVGTSLYYGVALPAGSRASVVVTPTSSTDRLNARVFDDCSAIVCASSASSATDGAAVTVNVDNPGPTPRTVWLAVSSARTTPVVFSLAVSAVAIPYRYETFAGVCDDLSGAVPLAGITSGDSYAPNAALPFTFRFFGVDEGYRTVSSNGFLQLFTTSGTFGTVASANLSIPGTGNPNAVVAPFWDNLEFVPGETTDIRESIFGTAPNRHVTFEWNHWSVELGSSVRLRFQARLYETSNQIEFVYCDIVSGTSADLASGGSATVGLENGTGTDGVTYSRNRAGMIRTDTSLRWVPIP